MRGKLNKLLARFLELRNHRNARRILISIREVPQLYPKVAIGVMIYAYQDRSISLSKNRYEVALNIPYAHLSTGAFSDISLLHTA